MKRCSLKEIIATHRSSRSQMFFKIGVLRNFPVLTEKHLCWSHFLLKKTLNIGVFLVNIAKFLRTAFFIEHL